MPSIYDLTAPLRRGSAIVAIGLLLSTVQRLPAAQGPLIDGDDQRVVAAALASVIETSPDRPPPGPLVFLSSSIAMCGRIYDGRCARPEHFERFRQRLTQRIGVDDSVGPEVDVAVPNIAGRNDLISAAIARNSARRPWVGLMVPGLVLMSAEQEAALVVRDNPAQYAGFSLPGYSQDGQALVYGFYRCGPRCGKGWLFLLQRRGAAWAVVSRYMLWIS